MLQEQYEKHNLEMQPYLHYLAEYQKMKPEDIGRHLEIPYDEREGLFRLRFMGKNYAVSHPELEIHCLEEPDGQAVLCRDLPWGEVYYRQFYGRCIMRQARTFGNRLADFRNIMEGLNGIPRQYGDAACEFEFLEGLRLCFVLWEGDEEFLPSAQILFSDNFPVAYAAEDAAYIGDVVLDYMKIPNHEGGKGL